MEPTYTASKEIADLCRIPPASPCSVSIRTAVHTCLCKTSYRRSHNLFHKKIAPIEDPLHRSYCRLYSTDCGASMASGDYFRGGDKPREPLRSKNHVLQAPAPAKANVHHASMLNNPNP